MNGQLSASDVMALTKDNDGFGGVGLIILLFIFLIGIGKNMRIIALLKIIFDNFK